MKMMWISGDDDDVDDGDDDGDDDDDDDHDDDNDDDNDHDNDHDGDYECACTSSIQGVWGITQLFNHTECLLTSKSAYLVH